MYTELVLTVVCEVSAIFTAIGLIMLFARPGWYR